jgi:hypothetical protein
MWRAEEYSPLRLITFFKGQAELDISAFCLDRMAAQQTVSK